MLRSTYRFPTMPTRRDSGYASPSTSCSCLKLTLKLIIRRHQLAACSTYLTSLLSYGKSSSWAVAGSSSCAHTLVSPVFVEVCHVLNFPVRATEQLIPIQLLSVERESLDKRAPITVKFEIPYFTVSGIQVRYLKIVEKSGYQALPWVRYITQNGDDYRCVVRCRVGLAYVDFADVRAQSADCAGERQRSDRPWNVRVWGLRRRCVCVLHCTLCALYIARPSNLRDG